jgi:cytoskeletal protein CcmA (bactofilin family)
MWKRQDEPVRNPDAAATPAKPFHEGSAGFAAAQFGERKMEVEQQIPRNSVAHIGKSVQIKGELTGSEDLYIDGIVEGTIELPEYRLTVGESGRVKANINAKNVVIVGTVKGNIRAVDNVTIRKTGSLVGDLVLAGVIIEEGAYFKGSIDIQKAAEPAAKPSAPRKGDAAPPPPAAGGGQYAGIPAVAKSL